jgi:putative ABC transport system permease protein
MGITEEDVAAAAALPEVAEIRPAFSVDVMTTIGSMTTVCSVHSIDAQDTLLTLTGGRMPESPNECVADARVTDIKIVDTVTIENDNKEATLSLLEQRSFTVVGSVRSAAYFAEERGNTDIGAGRIYYFLYVPETAFSGEYYTELSLRLRETAGLSAFSDEYERIAEGVAETLESFGQQRADIRYAEIQQEAQQELNDAIQEYNDERESSGADLTQAAADLNEGSADLNDSWKKYNESLREFNQASSDIEAARSELASSRQTLDEGWPQLDAASAQLAQAAAALQTLNEQAYALQAALAAETDPVKIGALNVQLLAVQEQIPVLTAQAAEGEAQIATQRQELEDGEAQYNTGLAEFQSAEAQQLTYKAELDSFYTDLKKAEADLSDGQDEYSEQSVTAQDAFTEAREQIDEGREELEKLENPEWILQDRQDFPGYSGLASDVQRIGRLSLLIPWFLFLIAALVCLTTMTRMVEEQRTQIGTLKALGFSQDDIKSMYQCYTWFVGILGGAVGVVAGLLVFPRVVYGAYGSLYNFGAFEVKIEPVPCLIGLVGGAATISVAAFVACRRTLKNRSAVLMRPKAPKAGKRVLLEQIPFVWQRLTFSMKVTMRNLFRYKNRFFMTILGVAGCAALLLAAFGLRDSIAGLVDLQFEDISPYQATIMLKESSNAAADTDLNNKLAGYNALYMHVAAADVSAADRTNSGFVTYLYVPEDPAELSRAFTFRERAGQAPVAFPPEQQDGPSAVITERLATVLGLRAGDTMQLTPTGMQPTDVRVAGVTENYVYNYVYVTPADYQALFGEPPAYATVIVDSDLPQEDFDMRMADIVGTENVTSALSVSQIREIMDGVVANMSVVVWAIIFVACLLALIVLYNLVNVNITERERELATLKVLGFTRQEVVAYISRETTILTMFGTAVGLGVGIFLHRYVMASIEVNEVMFSRVILPQSYLYAVAFTLGCSFLIRLVMRPRLKNIDPASSLKSVE